MPWPDLTKRANALWFLVIADALLLIGLVVLYMLPHAPADIRTEVKGVFEGYNTALFLAFNLKDPQPPQPPITTTVPSQGA